MDVELHLGQKVGFMKNEKEAEYIILFYCKIYPSIATDLCGLYTDSILEKTSPPPVAISKTESAFLINFFAICL
jgi:hypothetical protein